MQDKGHLWISMAYYTDGAFYENVTNVQATLLPCRNCRLFRVKPRATLHLCRTKTKTCMIIVFISVIGFFGIFFWQVDRLNNMAEKRHLEQPENPYLWPQKVSKHA